MNTDIARTPLHQVTSIKALLHNNEARMQLSAVAARHMTPERLMRATANSIRTTPKLAEADPLSFFGALMTCASLGLEPGPMGLVYLVPFKNNRKKITEVQVIVGAHGVIDLVRRSGHIKSISAHAVYEDDLEWEWREGSDPQLRHVLGDQEGEISHFYAIVHFTKVGFAHVVLPEKKVLKVRDRSQVWQTAINFNSNDKSPWHIHFDQMGKKTAIRALAKHLPLSVEFRKAASMDENTDKGQNYDFAFFAMNPDDGPVIDGAAEEIDSGDAGEDMVDDEDVEPEPKPKPQRANRPLKRSRGNPMTPKAGCSVINASPRRSTTQRSSSKYAKV